MGITLLITVHISHFLPGRLEETEEELVQLKIEREAERQRRAKYGTANGAAVEAMTSSTAEPPGEGGGEVWEAGEDGETGKATVGELTTSQGEVNCTAICMQMLCSVLCMCLYKCTRKISEMCTCTCMYARVD